MKNTALTLFESIFTSLIFASGCLALENPPRSRIAVMVVDDIGNPVTGAYVNAWSYWKSGGIVGITDTNGLFRYEDHVHREIGYTVRKKGHYDSIGEAWWPKTRYQVPETNLVVVLKRIVEPLSMECRSVVLKFPELNGSFGFDLSVGDWVFPYGKGSQTDLLIAEKNDFTSWNDFSLSVQIAFTNALDGIQPFTARKGYDLRLKSKLLSPQIAPWSGYTNSVLCWIRDLPRSRVCSSFDENVNYIFRVRTKVDAFGAITSANVGWIQGDFMCSPSSDQKGEVSFTYYYNPDPHSRSLEPKEIADRQAKDIPEMVK